VVAASQKHKTTFFTINEKLLFETRNLETTFGHIVCHTEMHIFANGVHYDELLNGCGYSLIYLA
jgi:hypothetical protein